MKDIKIHTHLHKLTNASTKCRKVAKVVVFIVCVIGAQPSETTDGHLHEERMEPMAKNHSDPKVQAERITVPKPLNPPPGSNVKFDICALHLHEYMVRMHVEHQNHSIGGEFGNLELLWNKVWRCVCHSNCTDSTSVKFSIQC
eukprot:3693314-Amphidinium_carterae.1